MAKLSANLMQRLTDIDGATVRREHGAKQLASVEDLFGPSEEPILPAFSITEQEG